MPRRNRRPRYQDKMVIGVVADVRNIDRIKELDSYNYISNLVEKILTNKNVITDRVFIGGDKDDLLVFLSNIIWNFQFRDVYMDDDTEYYEGDIDFD
jgi:hypothetical protein